VIQKVGHTDYAPAMRGKFTTGFVGKLQMRQERMTILHIAGVSQEWYMTGPYCRINAHFNIVFCVKSDS